MSWPAVVLDALPRLGIAAGVAAGVAAAAIGLLRPLASRLGLLDRAGVDPLKIHERATPVVGGLGILVALPCVALALAILPADPSASRSTILFLAAGGVAGLALAGLGLYDDLTSAPPASRLVVEVGVGLGLAIAGQVAGALDPGRIPWLPAWMFPIIAAGFLTFVVNAFNMQDGLDAHAGSLALASCLGFVALGLATLQWGLAASAAVLSGAVLGFLVHNWPKARVFLGDNGSYLVGGLMAMMAGWVAFRPSSGSAPVWPGLVAAVLLVGVPVLDLAVAVLRRTLRGESPLRGDRSHYYDWLRRRGFPASAIALIALVLQSTLSLLAFGVVFLFGRPT